MKKMRKSDQTMSAENNNQQVELGFLINNYSVMIYLQRSPTIRASPGFLRLQQMRLMIKKQRLLILVIITQESV